MFRRKRCRNCGESIKGSWEFCPFCGVQIRARYRPFERLFEDIEREFRDIDRFFRPMLRMPTFEKFPGRGGGISITISSGLGREPRIEVRTSGEYKKLEPEIKRRFGIKEPIKELEERPKERLKIPKVTEEPEMKIERAGKREIISIKLPEVKKIEDVEIKKLEQSIEVKAFTDDKAYFKLIPIAQDVTISEKRLEDGVLKIELER
jgi:HSP20 family molecular chaperone IbpA